MTPRLSLVAEAIGSLDEAVALRPAASASFRRVVTGNVVDAEAFRLAGAEVMTECPEAEVIVVCPPRSKRYAQALIEEAARKATRWVVVDGHKTDGIEGLFRACRSRVEVQAATKSHGRAFWFAPTDVFAEWRDPGPQPVPKGFWTQPGVFSEGKIDPATACLMQALPDLGGDIADLGGGWGALTRAALDKGASHVHLVEAEARAIDCARRTLESVPVTFHWADATTWIPPSPVSTVIMNPPFHHGRAADPALGQAFIRAAARMLTPSGRLFMVANRHLPYEAEAQALFREVEELPGVHGFKVLRAARPSTGRRVK